MKTVEAAISSQSEGVKSLMTGGLKNFRTGAITDFRGGVLLLEGSVPHYMPCLRHTAYNCLSRKKIGCTKKVYEMDHVETSLWISPISFLISFNKVGNFTRRHKENMFGCC